MEKAVEHLNSIYGGIRAGKATKGLVAHLKVEYYGQTLPLEHIATITVPEPRLLAIKPFDANAAIDIEKAILKSSLGIQPQRSGGLVRVNVPPLSEERRQELAKYVAKIAEEQRVSIRNIRREGLKSLAKLTLPTDQSLISEEKIDVLTKEYEDRVTDAFEDKSRDLQGLDTRWTPNSKKRWHEDKK